MSPSTIARKTWAALTGVGTAAIVAALAIGMTGWPPAEAFAEGSTATTDSVSLTLTPEPSYAAATVSALPATSTGSVASVVEAKQKSLTKAPVAKKKAKKARKARVRRHHARVRWQTARVSWYGPGFYGNTMAGGGKLTRSSMVVAHRSLPFGTRVQFRYRGRSCVAVVQDRGPYVSGRMFDLGPGTARALGFSGVANVQYRILKRR